MLSGKVKLQLFAPTLDDLLAKPVKATISQNHIEFNDVSFTDLHGDPFDVLPAQIDVKGSHVTYKIISQTSGMFADVDDHGGFNGYVMTFASLGGGHGKTLRSAQIVAKNTTLDIDKSNVFVSKTSLYVNVDDLSFAPKDTIDVKLSFKMHGNGHSNNLSGHDGDDLIIGGRGADTLTGRGGADTFEFTRGASRGAISDFNAAQGDRIDLLGLDDSHGRSGGRHVSFIGDGAFSGSGAAEIRVQHASSDLYVVTADRDGDGRGDITVNVHSAGGVHAGDFDF